MGHLFTSRGYSTLFVGFIFAVCLIDQGWALKKSKITLTRKKPDRSISCGHREHMAIIDIVYTTVHKGTKCIQAESTTSYFSKNAHDIVVSCHDNERCNIKFDKNVRKRCGNGEAYVKKLDVFYACTSSGDMAQFCNDNKRYGSEGLIRYGAHHTTCSCVLSVQHSRRLSIFQLYSSQDDVDRPLRSVVGPPKSHQKCDLLSTVMNKRTPTRSQYICPEHPLVLLYSEPAENFRAQLTVMEGQLDTVFYYRAEEGQNVTLTCRPPAVLYPTDAPRVTTGKPQGWPTLRGDGSSEEEDEDDAAGTDMHIIIIGASSGVVLLIIGGIVGGIIFAFRRKKKLSEEASCPPGGARCSDVRRSNTYTSSPGDAYQPPPLVVGGPDFDPRFSNPITEGGMYEDLVGGGPVSPPPYTAMQSPSAPLHPPQKPPPYSPANQQVAPPPYKSHVYQMPDSAVYEDVTEGASGPSTVNLQHEGRPTSADNFTYTYAGAPETVYEDLDAGAMSRDGGTQRGARQALRPPKAKPPVLPKPSRPVLGYDNSHVGNAEAPRDLDVSSNPLYGQSS